MALHSEEEQNTGGITSDTYWFLFKRAGLGLIALQVSLTILFNLTPSSATATLSGWSDSLLLYNLTANGTFVVLVDGIPEYEENQGTWFLAYVILMAGGGLFQITSTYTGKFRAKRGITLIVRRTKLTRLCSHAPVAVLLPARVGQVPPLV